MSSSPRVARAVRAVVASWRALTGGAGVRDEVRRTLVACSGGVDSTALTIALASAGKELVVGHVLHDMRPRAQAEVSRDSAKLLAARLGLRFVEAEVAVKGLKGNYESHARSHRYRALARLAGEQGCTFVASGHQQDDQLETVLMRLIRGAGPRGMGGLARSRILDASDPHSPRLVRPMLGISRGDAMEICRAAGATWVDDETNRELASLRNSLRHRVLPVLFELAPRAGQAAVASADLSRQASLLVAAAAKTRLEQAKRVAGAPVSLEWARESLRSDVPIVLGEVLHLAALDLGVRHGADRRGSRGLSPVVAAMRDHSTEPREFVVGGLAIRITARAVTIHARSLPSTP